MVFKDIHQAFAEGVVVEVVHEHKEWRIQVYGVLWFARSTTGLSFKPGDTVRVVGRKGIKLIIDM